MRLLLLALCLVCGPAPAWAGVADAGVDSATDWTIGGERSAPSVVLRVSLPATVRLPPADVASHVDVHAGAALCPLADQGEGIGTVNTLAPLPDLRRFELVFQCASSGPLQLDNHILFDLDPERLDFARLHGPGGEAIFVFDAAHQSAAFGEDGAMPGSPLARLAWHGFTQLGTRAGLVALVVLAAAGWRTRRDGLVCAAALAIGAAAAVASPLYGVAAVQPGPAWAMLALTTLLLAVGSAAIAHPRAAVLITVLVPASLAGVEALRGDGALAQTLLGGALLAPALVTPAAWGDRLRVVVPAALFGLLADAGFAGSLQAVHIPPTVAALLAASHAAGTWLAAGLAGAAAVGAARFIRRSGWSPWVASLARTGLAGGSAFWLAQVLHA